MVIPVHKGCVGPVLNRFAGRLNSCSLIDPAPDVGWGEVMNCPKSAVMKVITLLGCVLLCSSCALSYRHHTFNSQIEEGGTTLNVDGSADVYHMGVVIDFLYGRLILPFEILQRTLDFTDSEGGVAGRDTSVEQRAYRLEVPVLSIWNHKEGFAVNYPGMLRKRQSFEIWLGADSDLLKANVRWFADIGVTYYHYNIGAVRLFAGYGQTEYSVSTQGIGPQFPNTWGGDLGSWAIGGSITIFAGEYALEFFEYILDLDEKHRSDYPY